MPRHGPSPTSPGRRAWTVEATSHPTDERGHGVIEQTQADPIGQLGALGGLTAWASESMHAIFGAMQVEVDLHEVVTSGGRRR